MVTPARETTVRQRLGDILVERGKISREKLEETLETLPRQHRELLGDLLVARGYITMADLAEALALQNGYRYVKLSDVQLDPSLARLIPERLAQLNRLVPIEKKGNTLVVAMADPSHSFVLDSIQLKTGLTIEPCIAIEQEVLEALQKLYVQTSNDTLKEILKATEPQNVELVETKSEDISLQNEDSEDDAPVIRLVNFYISESIKRRSSDLHIEPKEHHVVVRMRIDGVLHPIQAHPKRMHNAVVSRIKIMSELNISERRLPQDGRFKLKSGDKLVDFRVSVLPTVFGEKIVLRLLDSSNLVLDPALLGFLPEQRQLFESAISKPYGMMLVTGPTGSGKTTTLYTALQMVSDPSKNIITTEDPVEYRLESVTQVQVRSSIGFTFASALRSILRQDPDIVMVGEIRDLETAEIAIKASLTGHFVLSTLHTNNAASAITRMADMGIAPYLITSSLVLVVAQRLARRICKDCKQDYPANEEQLTLLGLNPATNGNVRLYRGTGCETCNGTGYKGRIALYEMIAMTDHLRRCVLQGMAASEIKNEARKCNMRTMRESGIVRVLDGTTTVEEILRVTFEDEDITAPGAAATAPAPA